MNLSKIRPNRRWHEPEAVAKRRSRHRIVYDGSIQADVEVVMMAMTGMTTRAIADITGLSPSQVQYRISKAQNAEGLDEGYRGQWRNGNSQWFKQFQRVIAPEMEAAIKAELPARFVLPPVKAAVAKA